MMRAWLLTLDFLIKIGLIKLPQEKQPELDQHHSNQPEEQQQGDCNEDVTESEDSKQKP